jgi:hypothetical protein
MADTKCCNCVRSPPQELLRLYEKTPRTKDRGMLLSTHSDKEHMRRHAAAEGARQDAA